MYKPAPALVRKSSQWPGVWLVLAIPVVVLATVFALIQLTPPKVNLSYELTPSQLIIHYGDGPVLERTAITSVDLVQPGEGNRLMGSSLPGQYTGYWSFPNMGRLRLYCSSLSTIVVIRTADSTIGISPSEPATFQKAWETGGTGLFQSAPDQGNRISFGPFVILGVLILAILAVLLMLKHASRHLYYRLDEAELTACLGPLRQRIPYATITRIYQNSPDGSPSRVVGFGLPDLLWGRFNWPDVSPIVKLYATRSKPLVLLQTPACTYGVSPSEEAAFVSDIQSRVGQQK